MSNWHAWLVLLNISASLYLCGTIWTVQVVHYPLFDRVGNEAAWRSYHMGHSRLMTWVVLLPMVVELGTASLLALAPPAGTARTALWIGLALVVLIWIVTFFISVPHHQTLSGGFTPAVHRALVATNWIRTVAWTARGVLVIDMLRRLI